MYFGMENSVRPVENQELNRGKTVILVNQKSKNVVPYGTKRKNLPRLLFGKKLFNVLIFLFSDPTDIF